MPLKVYKSFVMSKRKTEAVNGAAEIIAKKQKTANSADELAEKDLKKRKKKEKSQKREEKRKSKSQETIITEPVENAVHNGEPVASEPDADKVERKKAREEKRARKAENAAKKASQSEASEANGVGVSLNGSDAVASSEDYATSDKLHDLPQHEVEEYLSLHDIKYVDAAGTKQNYRPITKFEYLPGAIAQAAIFKNFSSPTPVQASTWPYMLSGRDVIGVAETGSGKTLAFGLPCVQRISTRSKKGRKGIQAVIVSPTRELASQIYDQLKLVAAPLNLNVCCVYGGVPKDYQREELRTAHIVVATPGRLNDFLQEGAADLSNAEFACLDEADRMLDKGFEDDIRKILGATAPAAKRQTVMFTATWPQSVRDLASTFMKTPIQIYIGRDVKGDLQANMRIEQRVEVMDPKAKDQRLYQILRDYQKKNKKDRILIFCLYKKEATRVENNIRYKGFNVAGIHGDMTQQKRMESLEAFKNGTVPYLVATDVAARGLDIPAVKLVLNMTFPLTAEDYVHRIGRTGRAGQHGTAITFFTDHEKHLSGALINVLKSANQPVPEELLKFGTTVKKKEHAVYGAFFKDVDTTKKATKITFD